MYNSSQNVVCRSHVVVLAAFLTSRHVDVLRNRLERVRLSISADLLLPKWCGGQPREPSRTIVGPQPENVARLPFVSNTG